MISGTRAVAPPNILLAMHSFGSMESTGAVDTGIGTGLSLQLISVAYLDYGGFYGECEYGGCEYGECDYGECEYRRCEYGE